MKIIQWADVHNEHSVRSDNIEGELQSALVMVELKKHAIAEKPDWIFVLGDFLDRHGIIESDLANSLKDDIFELARVHGIKFVFVTGNHEYQEVKKRYFGRGAIMALFGDRESDGIYVVDAVAKFIDLGENHKFLGIPYRETWEQYRETCHEPIIEALKNGDADPKKDVIMIGWHVGLPWGQAWRGDEDENGWITPDHEAVKLLFNLAFDRRIYCGHYHGPDDTACGDLGIFTYVGSPATRTRAEGAQVKRVCIWNNGKVSFYETGMLLDKIVNSVEQAIAHKSLLEEQFGEEVLQITSIHINLGEDASRDDFNVAKAAVQKYVCITVLPPKPNRKILIDHIIEKHKKDPHSTREGLEKEIFLFSVKNNFKNKSFKGLSESSLNCLTAIPHKVWKQASRGDEAALAQISDYFLKMELGESSMIELSPEFCKQAADFSLTVATAQFIAMRN